MSLNSKSVVPFRQTNSLMGRAMIWTHKFRLKIKRKQLLRMGCQQQMDTSPERCKRQPLWCTNRSDIAKRRRKKGIYYGHLGLYQGAYSLRYDKRPPLANSSKLHK